MDYLRIVLGTHEHVWLKSCFGLSVLFISGTVQLGRTTFVEPCPTFPLSICWSKPLF